MPFLERVDSEKRVQATFANEDNETMCGRQTDSERVGEADESKRERLGECGPSYLANKWDSVLSEWGDEQSGQSEQSSEAAGQVGLRFNAQILIKLTGHN